jgi:hypothetical protein
MLSYDWMTMGNDSERCGIKRYNAKIWLEELTTKTGPAE